MSIKKAVFPAAGFGTRFLPATKGHTKGDAAHLLISPLFSIRWRRPRASGIEEVIFITGMGKSAIEDHFDTSAELELLLKEKGKGDILKEMEEL